MYKIIWDIETNGVILTDKNVATDMILIPRPVFFEELDLLGFDKHWEYPKTKEPLLWANGRRYYYKGVKVAEARGGNIFEAPQIIIEENAKGLTMDKIVTLFKYWQDGNYSNRLDVRFGTLEEKELVEKLKKIFNLNDATGLNDVRWGMRDFVKRAQFPLWSIKHLDVNDGLRNAIDEIFMLTKTPDSEIGYEDVKRVFDSIRNNELDLELNLKEEKIKQGFDAFLKDIEAVNITKAEIDEVVQYLYQNMQEEIASWEEEKVESKVKGWRLSKINEPQPPKPIDTTGTGDVKPPVDDEFKEKVKGKVKAYSGDLKTVIVKILDDKPDFASTLDRYL